MIYPKVSIIILNWNGLSDTVECLESLKNITYPNYDVIVVDNGSANNDADILEEEFAGYIQIIRNNKNYGFAEGNNIGIRYAIEKLDPQYILLLNNDTIVEPNFLNDLVSAAEEMEQVAFAGPKIYYYDFNGRKDVINCAGGFFNLWTGYSRHLGVNEIDKGQYDKTKMVDYVEGSCMLIKKKSLETIGFLDSSYFAYWEENDLCTRGAKLGYKSIYVPTSNIWHKISKSANRPFKIYLLTRNRFLFIKRHATLIQIVSSMLYFFIFRFWLQSGYYIIRRRRMKELVSFLRGVLDGLCPQKQ